MCACRVQEMYGNTRKSSYDLEDYIHEMENRNLGESACNETEDVYTQLAQKEKDLILAAELGKALLEKNDEMSRQNEKITEEYSHKLEGLEQEKHSMKRKIEVMESEYEAKVLELQSDVHHLRQSLDNKKDVLRQSEREKSQIISELTEQNQRLTNQLKESAKAEEKRTSELQSLREQFILRKSNIVDHVSHLELLREEINLLTEKKDDLVKRIEVLCEEREGLCSNLDESTDKILMLERASREQEIQLRNNERELLELRTCNLSLTDRLEAASRSHSTSPSMGNVSLMMEMDVSDERESMPGSGGGHSRPHSHPSMQDELLELEEIEQDDPDGSVSFPDPAEMKALKQEILNAYQQLKIMCDQIRHRRKNSQTSIDTSSSEEMTMMAVQVGLLSSVMNEIKGLLHDLLRHESKGLCLVCGQSPTKKLELEVELHETKENFDKLQRQLNEKTVELKHRSDEVMELTSKLTISQTELGAVQEERNVLRGDLENSHLTKDEIIKKSWEVRDQAVARKNAAEIELARTRIDLMQVNSQLMEAIQQKVGLSQQLEQWQVDMQQLLDEQMRRKLCGHEMKSNSDVCSDSDSSNSIEKRRHSRLFGLFSR